MRVLLSNDDGVYAKGIRVLQDELKSVAEVTIVAPLEERSTTGHTLSMDHPIRISKVDENIFGCSGYPADCTLMATGHLFKETPFDLIVSGINKGSNLGQDIYYSGTVAAAREASLHGHLAIAVSVNMDKGDHENHLHYKTAALIVKELIRSKAYLKIPNSTVLNINTPNLELNQLKGIEYAEVGERLYSQMIDERTDFRGRKYYWIGGKLLGHKENSGSDCDAVFSGKASLTILKIFPTTVVNEQEWRDVAKDLTKNLIK